MKIKSLLQYAHAPEILRVEAPLTPVGFGGRGTRKSERGDGRTCGTIAGTATASSRVRNTAPSVAVAIPKRNTAAIFDPGHLARPPSAPLAGTARNDSDQPPRRSAGRFVLLASQEGFEPPTHGLEGRCSIRLPRKPHHYWVFQRSSDLTDNGLLLFCNWLILRHLINSCSPSRRPPRFLADLQVCH